MNTLDMPSDNPRCTHGGAAGGIEGGMGRVGDACIHRLPDEFLILERPFIGDLLFLGIIRTTIERHNVLY